jgi:hypothetical protein
MGKQFLDGTNEDEVKKDSFQEIICFTKKVIFFSIQQAFDLTLSWKLVSVLKKNW